MLQSQLGMAIHNPASGRVAESASGAAIRTREVSDTISNVNAAAGETVQAADARTPDPGAATAARLYRS